MAGNSTRTVELAVYTLLTTLELKKLIETAKSRLELLDDPRRLAAEKSPEAEYLRGFSEAERSMLRKEIFEIISDIRAEIRRRV
jgi:hypothetical protein